MNNANSNSKGLSKSLLYLMTVSAGLIIANNYYNQPLLHLISETFHVSEGAVSYVASSTQWGYALGVLILLPLGDMVNVKKILNIDAIVMVLSLIGAAISPSLNLLIAASFCIGFTSTIPQLLIPLSANLAKPENQGKVTGLVMTGLLVGIIGSRILSGVIGQYWGWRAMFYVSAVIVAVLFALLNWKLPRIHPDFKGSYAQLMKTVFTYFKEEPVLRLTAVRGALAFASLSAFWTTLIFVFHDSFGYGSQAAGLFGFFGIIGALGASVTGKLSDRMDRNKLVFYAIGFILISWIVLFFSTYSLIGLAIGAIVTDLGANMMNVTNQNIIFSKKPEGRSRVNAGYMFIFFIGGALGTLFGALAYQHFGWQGVSVLGFVLAILMGIIQLIFRKIK